MLVASSQRQITTFLTVSAHQRRQRYLYSSLTLLHVYLSASPNITSSADTRSFDDVIQKLIWRRAERLLSGFETGLKRGGYLQKWACPSCSVVLNVVVTAKPWLLAEGACRLVCYLE